MALSSAENESRVPGVAELGALSVRSEDDVDQHMLSSMQKL